MNEFRAILWATDKLELGNIGAREYMKIKRLIEYFSKSEIIQPDHKIF